MWIDNGVRLQLGMIPGCWRTCISCPRRTSTALYVYRVCMFDMYTASEKSPAVLCSGWWKERRKIVMSWKEEAKGVGFEFLTDRFGLSLSPPSSGLANHGTGSSKHIAPPPSPPSPSSPPCLATTTNLLSLTHCHISSAVLRVMHNGKHRF